MVVSVDGLLERLGRRYQLLVLLLLIWYLVHVGLTQHLHHHYLASPPHRCKLPEGWQEEDALPTVLVVGRGGSVQQEESPRAPWVGYSSCEMYRDPQLHRKGTKPCVHGYVFTLQAAEWSVVAEWGLVCDRVWIKHWVVTSYLIGLVIGGLLFGFLADRFGRRNLLLVCVVTVGSLGLALHFVRRLVVFLSLRFIQAIFLQGVYVTSWTLLAELFPPRWRCRALVCGGMARPLGVALAALMALLVQHWRAMQLATSLPMIITLLYCWLVPESLRWLLTRGKTRRARWVAAHLARHNLLTLPPTAHAQMDHLAAHVYLDVPWGSLLTLFKTPRLRRHTFIVVFMWLAVSLADSGFRNELAGLESSPGQLMNLLGSPGHLGSLLGAGVEAGAVVLAVVLTTQLYRRAFLVLCFLLTAALAIAVICVLQLVKDTWLDVDALATALRFLGVLVVGGARVGVGVVSVEVTPTTARASAVGLCAAHAAMGEILAPLLAVVAELTYPSVPWLTSAAGCLLAALLALLLPETAGTTLPDVVDESEVVGLCHRGDLLKSCDGEYGKSPYWAEDDRLTFGRSVPDDGVRGNGDKFKNLDRNLDSQLVAKASGGGDKEVSQLAQVAGPSQVMMVLPHVQTHRRELSPKFSRSTESLTSSCSHCSVVSLVDVSRVNGNNSDTSDTTDSNYSKDQKETAGQASTSGRGATENVYTKTKETEEQRNITISSENAKEFTGKTSLPFKEEENIICEKSQEKPGEDAAVIDEDLKGKELATAGPVESDVSISVCSLQFKHIRRPVSPTDRRRGSGLHYSSSSAYEAGAGRTLIQEYMSRNSFRGDTSSLRYTTLFRKKESAQERASGDRITSPSSILKECIRIARNKERLTELQEGASKSMKTDFGTLSQQHTDTSSSRASEFSSATSETAKPNLLRISNPSNGSLSTVNNFTPSSTLEYEAGGSRTEMTARTLRYDTLRTTQDPGGFEPLYVLDGQVKHRPVGHQLKGHHPDVHQPEGHQPEGHQPDDDQPKGHQAGEKDLFKRVMIRRTYSKPWADGKVSADGTGIAVPAQGRITTGVTVVGASTRGATGGGAVRAPTRGPSATDCIVVGALTRGVGATGGKPLRTPIRGAKGGQALRAPKSGSVGAKGGLSEGASTGNRSVPSISTAEGRSTKGAPPAGLATPGATDDAAVVTSTRVTDAKATETPTCVGKRDLPENDKKQKDAHTGLANTWKKDATLIRKAITMTDLDETHL